jgi:hypothetical protein
MRHSKGSKLSQMSCTKPNCDCVEKEEQRIGGPVKYGYPCLHGNDNADQMQKVKSLTPSPEEPSGVEEAERESDRLYPMANIDDYPENPSVNQKNMACQSAFMNGFRFKQSLQSSVGWLESWPYIERPTNPRDQHYFDLGAKWQSTHNTLEWPSEEEIKAAYIKAYPPLRISDITINPYNSWKAAIQWLKSILK